MDIWKEDYIVVNKFSRPDIKLMGVKGIVMHWTATNGATDENEHDFFDGSDGGGGRYASAHFFVDSDSATLIIPLDSCAYHANEHPCRIDKLKATNKDGYVGGANLTTIGIEMCVEKDGTIHPDTISRSVEVATELCKRYNLNPLTDIYRHFDITGKYCPAPWVADVQKFIDFKNRVNSMVNPPQVQQAVQPKTVIANKPKVESNPATKPVSAPVKKKFLVLPATEVSWRVYPINKAPQKGNESGTLNPKKFGGLTYEIIGNPQKDVYTIQTSKFGKVQIFADASTGAKIVIK